ncbi:MAG TPA: caspase family protein [Polyangium sp.]|nr:caspase family protein [Polyangium sp.]
MKRAILGTLFLACAEQVGCAPTATLLPVAVIKAEPTADFPMTWDGSTTMATSMAHSMPVIATELSPKPGTSVREKSLALVVGVEKYRSNVQDAVGAEADARLFSSYAEKTLGLAQRNIHMLLGQQATKSSISAEIEGWLRRKASPTEEVFVYFAGHGAPDPETKATYLLPWDADPQYVSIQGISVQSLMRDLNEVRASSVVVFLDACFSGAGGRSVIQAGARPIFAEVSPPPSMNRVLLLSATGPNEITGTARTGNGLFSYHLFLGLNGAADIDNDHSITGQELSDYVGKRVADAAQFENRSQHPQTTGEPSRLKKLVLTKQVR